MIFNPKKANFDTKEKYEKARLRTVTLLENVASVYLEPDEMLEILHRATSFSGYFLDLKEFMEPKEYWKIPVDIKVLPGRRGPETAVFPPFIRKAGDTTMPLRFSEHELKLFDH
jgi:hypothetical protein